jgi:hypothetical protein
MHLSFEAEQTSQLPFLSQNEIVHCWLNYDFPYPWTMQIRPIFSVNTGTCQAFGRHCVPSFFWEEEDPAIDAIKMLIKQVQHAKVANVQTEVIHGQFQARMIVTRLRFES